MAQQGMAVRDDAGDDLQVGLAALERHEWQTAFDRLSAADRDGRLTAPELESLGLAAFFTGQADHQRELIQRAFTAYRDGGDETRAAYLALHLARAYGYDGKFSIAAAWLRRAERILGEDGDTYAHGYLALVRSEAAAKTGEIDAALALAERAIAIGSRAADRDLRAFAQSNLGALKIATGETADGFALMEEASIAAVNGELTPFTTGITCCRMIATCRDLQDYRRASEWIEATEEYCERQSVAGFPGICRIHKAEMEVASGAWEQAERELERATVELTAYRATPPQADGYYALGEVRRLKGDLAGAEAALREAHALGRSPQPALALIRLAEGNATAAWAAMDGALGDDTWDRGARFRLLPAAIEIAVAAGEVGRARAAVDELAGIGDLTAPAAVATRRVALGRVLVAEGDHARAAHELRSGVREWREVGAPYEVARARVVLASALFGLGDDDAGELELRTAADEFRRLGAGPDAAAAEQSLRSRAERHAGPAQVGRTFMFTDIVGSTKLAEALGDTAWAELLRWHDAMLRRLVTDGGGQIVNTTGDGIFAAFDDARRAVDCAIAIQRALREHRATSGFAPGVRIGLHSGEANRQGDDYSGVAVHVAARVGALADGGEILVTAETLEAAGRKPAGPLRTESVKGIAEPITFGAIDWS